MPQDSYDHRTFLFLQGPHGPFFDQLGRMMRAAGCGVWRVGFNLGDAVFWRDKASYLPFKGPLADWDRFLTETIQTKKITDIVLYGDTKPVHETAKRLAQIHDLTVHVFEEGYMRPYWATYERQGANGHSRLIDMTVEAMQTALDNADLDVPEAPAHWGDMYQHIVYGALYHLLVMGGARLYPHQSHHRAIPVAQEFTLYFKRFLLMPFQKLGRWIHTRRIKSAGYPYHLVLMQLDHDSAFVKHSPFDTMEDFIKLVTEGFAEGAPRHHHLVFKGHPMESGRLPFRKVIKTIAREFGVENRVHYVHGGKLAQLLHHARTAVTVNSTAAQQVLWRGIPLKVFGAAVYNKPEFVSTQPLVEFFHHPSRPNNRAYLDYRRYLLETSQIAGGYYSARGRRQLLRQVADLMLYPLDPYDALEAGTAAPRQQLQIVTP